MFCLNKEADNSCTDKIKTIPIAFSTNDLYLPYLGVAICSLINNVSSHYNYIVNVLHIGLDSMGMKRILSMATNNVSINFINISDKLKDLKNIDGSSTELQYLTIESTFRLFLPELFPEYDKILYLDCDAIILQDVAQLYLQDLGENEKEYCLTKLNISPDKYFNAGVLVIDLKKFKEQQLTEKSLALLQYGHSYIYLDQDALNITCFNKASYLDERWNVAPISICDNEETTPFIIHYIGSYKPWQNPEAPMSNFFWKYAKLSLFYEKILFDYIHSNELVDRDNNSILQFLYDEIPAYSSIALYGAGGIGQIYERQLQIAQITGYCKLVIWLDKDYVKKSSAVLKIKPPIDIINATYDFVVIALEKESIANEIKGELIALGVKADKIIWRNPKK